MRPAAAWECAAGAFLWGYSLGWLRATSERSVLAAALVLSAAFLVWWALREPKKRRDESRRTNTRGRLG